jgi:hypothetical protein
MLRDADGDGVPDGHCVLGGDCDDHDPNVYPGHPEICNNHKDDNCNGLIDEMPCQTPSHDTCLDPLEIKASGLYSIDTTGASFDYGGSCALANAAKRRDVVAAVIVEGGPKEVDVIALAPAGGLAIGLASTCGKPETEIACETGVTSARGGSLARIRGRSLAAGAYPLYVWTDSDELVTLQVQLANPSLKPTNETCGTAAPIAIGPPTMVSLVDTAPDLPTKCDRMTGDLVYSFALDEPKDVDVNAVSLDGFGNPSISLRSASCSGSNDEIACSTGSQASVFARAVGPGTSYVSVSATADTEVQVTVTTRPPSVAPPDETCEGAPLLVPNRTLDVSLLDHTDDITFSCSPSGAADAAYQIDLPNASDVLLVERISSGDSASVALAFPACGSGDALACTSGNTSPLRASARGVPAGSYRAVAESSGRLPVELTAWIRPAAPPALVPFSDTCATAALVDPRGGFFQGNTSNASADYPAGCDASGQAPGGAQDQMLKLALETRKRVVLDMKGSSYNTLLDVRKGPACPGIEVPNGCTIGTTADRSFLDLTLDAGVYWIQVDGYAGDSGSWLLDVRVGDP